MMHRQQNARRSRQRRGAFCIGPLAGLVVGVGCQQELSPREHFEARVVPVLEQRCASAVCHGVDAAAIEAGDEIAWEQFFFNIDEQGRIIDSQQAYRATKRCINTKEGPEFSSLLRKPLSVEAGGTPHYGRQSFTGPEDEAYQTLYAWIQTESRGGEDPQPLGELEQYFADVVQPTLVEGTCMTSSCHGPTAGGTPYRLDVGYQGRFATAATRANYESSLRMLSLDGSPMQSRLLAKSLPLGEHGITHKGTNFDFYDANPHGVDGIVKWACTERLVRTGKGCTEPGDASITGFVFVGGPIERGQIFDLDAYVPGRDIYIASVAGLDLEVFGVENLTAEFHDGPVDIREPAVSDDGTRIAFSMRTRTDAGHRIYELNLRTRALRQRTFDPEPLGGGGIAADRDPTWGPDDVLWFVSTRAGVLGDRGDLLDADIYSLADDAEGMADARRWTWTRHIERKPVFFSVGQGASGEISFSALRETMPGMARAHIFRFPPSLKSEYHQHFGVNSVPDLIYDMRQLPNGRFVAVVGDLGNPWAGGQLGIVDRNFGPELDPGSEPDASGLPFGYAPPLVMLPGEDDPQSADRVLYRDPAALPDGRILATRGLVPEDPEDLEARLQTRIELLTLQEALDGSGPTLGTREVLLEAPEMGYSDPEPIFVRSPVRLDEHAHVGDADDNTGVFVHQGMAIIDALLSRLEPMGVKAPTDGFRHVRIVEALAETPQTRHAVDSEETRAGIVGATNTSLGPHSPARILGEFSLAEDGSFQARLPAGVSFRLQALDADHMTIGAMHNRWYHLSPGQKIVQGVSSMSGVARYNSMCAACHGAPDGDGRQPLDTEGLDMITGASLSLSRYEMQNPHRPIETPTYGDGTRVTVDFRRDVEPVLINRCAVEGCHTGDAPAAGLSLTQLPTAHYSDAYESLLAPGDGSVGGWAYVDASEGRARTSFLIEKLLGRELDAPGGLDRTGVRHPGEYGAPALDDDELLMLVRWIELGATYEGRPALER